MDRLLPCSLNLHSALCRFVRRTLLSETVQDGRQHGINNRLYFGGLCRFGRAAVGVVAVMMKLRSQSTEADAKVQAATEKLAVAGIQIGEADATIAARHKELQSESREVQAEVQRLRETIEKESQERRLEIKETEKRLRERGTHLERRLRQVEGRDKALESARKRKSPKRIEEADQLVAKQLATNWKRVAQLPIGRSTANFVDASKMKRRSKWIAWSSVWPTKPWRRPKKKRGALSHYGNQRCAVD